MNGLCENGVYKKSERRKHVIQALLKYGKCKKRKSAACLFSISQKQSHNKNRLVFAMKWQICIMCLL